MTGGGVCCIWKFQKHHVFPLDHLFISIGGSINLWAIQNRHMLVRVGLEKSLVVKDHCSVTIALEAVCSYAFKHQLPVHIRGPVVWVLRSVFKTSVLSRAVPHLNLFDMDYTAARALVQRPHSGSVISRAVWISKVNVQVPRGSLQQNFLSPSPCQMGRPLPRPSTVHSGHELLLITSDLSCLLLWLRDSYFPLIESYFNIMFHISNKNKST